MKFIENLSIRGKILVPTISLIVIALAIMGVRLLPLYLDNMRLQSYVERITQDAENRTRPDDALRVAVLEKAAVLGLPVKAENVRIKRSEDNMRIDVRYVSRAIADQCAIKFKQTGSISVAKFLRAAND